MVLYTLGEEPCEILP